MQSIILKIDGMTCVNCENRIEKMLKNTKGIIDTVVSYSSGTAEITYDENLIGIENIIEIIDGQGYKVVKETKEKANQRASLTKALGIAIILLSLYMIISRFGVFNVFNAFPQAEETTGYGMLFIIGLLTSLHCVAMCGGINLSQCVLQDTQKSNTLSKIAVLTPSFLYNLGRVLSYTIIGGIVGAVGSVAGFSGALKGVVQIAAGVFMVIMGLNMLNIFPWLRKFNPRMPKIFAKKINERKKSKSPLLWACDKEVISNKHLTVGKRYCK
jgi:copper chaperone CopZ